MSNFVLHDTEAGKVMRTTDYAKFHKLEGNREVLDMRLRRIRKSIEENGQLFSPIIVNEKMQIIDGQGRYTVFAELGLPIYYVMHKGYTLKECVILNASSSAWTMHDYIASYIEQGNENYIRFQKLIDEHKGIPMTAVFYSVTGASAQNYATAKESSNIQAGTLVVTEQDYNKANELLTYAEKFLPLFTSGHKARFLMAVMFAHEIKGLDKDKLLEKWEKYGKSPSFATSVATVSDAIAMLEKVYNYRLSTNSTVYMQAIYDRMCRKAHNRWRNNG